MSELFIRRNSSECLGAAWTLASTNVKKICKALWLPALATSILGTLLAPISQQLQNDIILDNFSGGLFGVFSLLIIAIICTQIYFQALVVKLLNKQPKSLCVKRVAAVTISCATIVVTGTILLSLLATAVGAAASSPTLGVVIMPLLLLIFLAFMTPLGYHMMKYMIEPDTKMRDITKNYKTGFKHWGFITGTILLMFLISVVIMLVLALPSGIAGIALMLSSEGMVMGDPSGLPEEFTWYVALTNFLTIFINCGLCVWEIFVMYYAYASIEARNGRTDEPVS